MRSVSAVAILAGPLVLVSYLAGSAAHLWLAGRPGAAAAPSRDGVTARTPLDLVAEGFGALAITTATWAIIQRVSPGSGFSRIGYFTDQVLAAWQSVALWSGAGFVAGLCASAFRRFEGGTGLAATAALLAAHFPWFLFGTAGAGVVAFAVTRTEHRARGAAIGALLPLAWLGWVLEWQPAWGLPAGPEATVWAMVISLVLGIRWWHDRPLTVPAA